MLCQHAMRFLREHNLVMFYSYCATVESEKVAQKSGLLPCAQDMYIQLVLKV